MRRRASDDETICGVTLMLKIDDMLRRRRERYCARRYSDRRDEDMRWMMRSRRAVARARVKEQELWKSATRRAPQSARVHVAALIDDAYAMFTPAASCLITISVGMLPRRMP